MISSGNPKARTSNNIGGMDDTVHTKNYTKDTLNSSTEYQVNPLSRSTAISSTTSSGSGYMTTEESKEMNNIFWNHHQQMNTNKSKEQEQQKRQLEKQIEPRSNQNQPKQVTTAPMISTNKPKLDSMESKMEETKSTNSSNSKPFNSTKSRLNRLDIEEHELRKKGFFKKELQKMGQKFLKEKKVTLKRSKGRLA